MSYLVIEKNKVIHLNDLRMGHLESARKQEVCLVDLKIMAFYDYLLDTWVKILTFETDERYKLAEKALGETEIFKIKGLAQLNLMKSNPPAESKSCLREYFLFLSLREYLISEKANPGFIMKP